METVATRERIQSSVSSHASERILDGMLFVNKPSGLTSHDVVQIVRRQLSFRRIGHTGTLDPMAEGLLILLVGAATKHQRAFQGHEKTYEATLRLGMQTDTGDAAGAPLTDATVPSLDEHQVRAVFASLTGELSQTPPSYSAVKFQGRPAYWWARRAQPVVLTPRVVKILTLKLLRLDGELLSFRVDCSAGTYVRTLAETIAQRLGTVGHLTSLTRLRIHDWSLEEAQPLAWVREASAAQLARELRPIPSTLLPQC